MLEKSGAWFVLDGERIGQGRDKACAFLAEHPEVADSLRDRLITAMKAADPAPVPVEREADDDDGEEAAA